MAGLLLSVHRLSIPSALAAPAPVATCVSGPGGAEGRKAGRGGGHTSFVPQIKKAETDRKTLDWEIVELTNKLLDAKNTINKLEELNVRAPRGPPRAGPWGVRRRAGWRPPSDPRLCLQERYRLDCNLAVQLLKCNKSHFRNHKFADVSEQPPSAGR